MISEDSNINSFANGYISKQPLSVKLLTLKITGINIRKEQRWETRTAIIFNLNLVSDTKDANLTTSLARQSTHSVFIEVCVLGL